MSEPALNGRRGAIGAAAFGCCLFLAACALPSVGLFRGHIDTSLFHSYGEAVRAGNVPYRDFALEYPPGALPAFVLPALGSGSDYDRWFMAFQALCGLGCVALVGLLTQSRLAAGYCALAPLALGPVVLHRYDYWPTLLALLGVAVVATRGPVGLAALGVGATAKVFPLALVPVALVRLGRRNAARALGWFLGAAILVIAPFAALGPGGVRETARVQTTRALQIESLASSALLVLHAAGGYAGRVAYDGSWNLYGDLPRALAVLTTALELTAVAAVCVLFACGPRTASRFFLASAATVAVWVAFGKVLSPQFLIWVVPFVALVRKTGPALLLLIGLGLTRAVYPTRYDELVALHGVPIALLAARNVVLLSLSAWLVLELQRERVPKQVGAQGERAHPGKAVLFDGGERDGPDGVPRLEP